MKSKELKEWANSLPDDAYILIHPAPHMSIPLRDACFSAIDKNGKAISSYPSPEVKIERAKNKLYQTGYALADEKEIFTGWIRPTVEWLKMDANFLDESKIKNTKIVKIEIQTIDEE